MYYAAHDIFTYAYIITMEPGKRTKKKITINQLKENIDQNHDVLEHEKCMRCTIYPMYIGLNAERNHVCVDERAIHNFFFLDFVGPCIQIGRINLLNCYKFYPIFLFSIIHWFVGTISVTHYYLLLCAVFFFYY